MSVQLLRIGGNAPRTSAHELRAEVKKLRLLFYGAQNEIATLTHSLEAVLRELQDLKQRQEASNG